MASSTASSSAFKITGTSMAPPPTFSGLLKLVGSEWCGPVLDTGYFNTPDPYVDISAKVAPYAISWQKVKQSVFDGGYGDVQIDLVRFMRIVRACGYSGYLPIETPFQSKGAEYGSVCRTVPAYLRKSCATRSSPPLKRVSKSRPPGALSISDDVGCWVSRDARLCSASYGVARIALRCVVPGARIELATRACR